jgi:hypothetical protein
MDYGKGRGSGIQRLTASLKQAGGTIAQPFSLGKGNFRGKEEMHKLQKDAEKITNQEAGTRGSGNRT